VDLGVAERQGTVLVLTVHQTVIDQEIVIVRIVQEQQVINNHAVTAHREVGKEGEVQDRIAVEKEIGLAILVVVNIEMKISMSCHHTQLFR